MSGLRRVAGTYLVESTGCCWLRRRVRRGGAGGFLPAVAAAAAVADSGSERQRERERER